DPDRGDHSGGTLGARPSRTFGLPWDLSSLVVDLLERLAAAVGEAHVVVGEDAEEFTHDATFMEHPMLAVVRPGSTEEVAAVVRVCHETHTPVVARGSGTSLVGGPVPLAGGVV